MTNTGRTMIFEDIYKSYPGVVALDGVNIEINKGEIHGLVGKNGAGKSTLVDIMYGRKKPDKGKGLILNNGNEISINFRRYSPEIAQRQGIYLAPQHPPFAPELTIEENFFLRSPIMQDRLRMDKRSMKEKTTNLLKKYELNLSPTQPLSSVGIEERHLLYFAMVADLRDSQVIFLDEVTAPLSYRNKNILFDRIDKIEEKKSIVFISHHIEEIKKICDRFTVLRDGEKVATGNTAEYSIEDISGLVVGRKRQNFDISSNDRDFSESKISLEVKNLSLSDHFKNVNLQVRNGEILGLAGLKNSGASVFLRSMGGIMPPEGGKITLEGRSISIESPQQAKKRGLIYCTKDRLKEGIFPTLSIEDNVNISVIDELTKNGLLSHSKLDKSFNNAANQMNIKYSNPADNIMSLSGGNQQKCVIGRTLTVRPKVYLMDGITQGIDVGAKFEILNLLKENLLKGKGTSIILIALYSIEELIGVSDRIVTFYHGQINSVFDRRRFDEKEITKAIQGVK